jgi:HEAT repeat protein
MTTPPEADLSHWIDCARSADPRTRRAAAAALGRTGDRRAVEPLLMMLQAPRPEYRQATAALRQLGETDLARAVLAVWQGDAGPAKRLRDPRLGGPLVAALGASSPQVRAAAADALGCLEDPGHVDPLIIALRGDPFPVVRCKAAQSLGLLGDTAALHPLLDSLFAEDLGTRAESATALGALGDERASEPLLRALQDPDAGVRRAAATSLGLLAARRAVEPLIAALEEERNSDAVRQAVVMALGRIRCLEAVPALIKALDDAGDSVTVAAAHALGQIGDPRALEALEQCRRGWLEPRLVKQACEEAIHAIRRRAGKYGGEVSPAASAGGRTTEVASPEPAEAIPEP